jgi:hypothetical protein
MKKLAIVALTAVLGCKPTPDNLNISANMQRVSRNAGATELYVNVHSTVPQVPVDCVVYADMEGRDGGNGWIAYAGPIWHEGKEQLPSLERLALDAGIIYVGSPGHPESNDPTVTFVNKRLEGSRLSLTYVIDPENKIHETSENDNVLKVTILPSDFPYLTANADVELNAYRTQARREEELQRKADELRAAGYKVTK